jgi:hypothetical protein
MIRVYGASDDLVEVEGHDKISEIDCYGRDIILVFGDAETGGVALRVSYNPHFKAAQRAEDKDPPGWACWSIEIVQLADECPIPWPISVTHETRQYSRIGYTVVVSIDAPSATPLLVVEVPRG